MIYVVMKKHFDAVKNPVILFMFIMLLKLIYFDDQILVQNSLLIYSAASIGALLVIASPAMAMRRKAAGVYLLAADAVISLVILCDIVFYRYFNDLISIPMIMQASSLGDVKSSLLQLFRWEDTALAVDFFVLGLVFLMKGQAWKGLTRHRKSLKQAAACFGVGLAIVCAGFVMLKKDQPTILQNFYDRIYVSQSIGLLSYHAADAFSYAEQSLKENGPLEEEKQQQIEAYLKSSEEEEPKEKRLFGAGKGMNLLVIQVEALQEFVIGREANNQEITPNLNKMAASGIYFEQYYYQTAGGGTSDAEFTAMTSMFPLKEGSAYIRKPGNYYYSLPLRLKEEGYSTIAMHGYKPGFWNRSLVYKNLGYDEFFSKGDMEETEVLGMGISDKAFFRQCLEKLKQQPKPFFAFAITLSSHFPYDNDKSQYGSFDVGSLKNTLLGDYLEAIHYADEALGEFLDELQENGMLENTVVVVYGDHHGIPKDSQQELAAFLGEENLTSLEWLQLQRVPMIMLVPGQRALRVGTVGGGVDFTPTILNLMGITDDSMPGFGRDLLNTREGMAVLRNGSFVTEDKIFISNENKYYDLSSGAEAAQEELEELRRQAEKVLEYSDTIMRYDLADELRDYLEGNTHAIQEQE